MSAQGIFEALQRRGWTELTRLVDGQEPESVHLDFKQPEGGATAELSESDITNIAKAVSAFANVEGGVLLLGVRATGNRKEADRAESVVALGAIAAAHRRLDQLSKGLTDPPVPGLDFLTLEDPRTPGQGVIAIYAPRSDGGPHQAAQGKHSGRYFIRTSTNSEPAPHSILAAMFGRQPPPKLRLAMNKDLINPALNVWVVNEGRGIADDAMVRISVRELDDSTLGANVHAGPFWTKAVGTVAGFRRLDMIFIRSNLVLYPDDPARVFSLEGSAHPSELRIRARIDCRSAMPVHVDAVVKVDGPELVPIPALGD